MASICNMYVNPCIKLKQRSRSKKKKTLKYSFHCDYKSMVLMVTMTFLTLQFFASSTNVEKKMSCTDPLPMKSNLNSSRVDEAHIANARWRERVKPHALRTLIRFCS